MAEEHKKESDSKSVEQNLAADYVPKSKLGDLPVSGEINDALKQKMDKTQKDINDFHKAIVKKFKYIEAVGIIPAQANKKVEEEFEISEADSKRELIHLLVIIPEKHFKEIGQVRLEAIELSKKINTKFWAHIMTPVDVFNLGLDSKFDIMEALSMSYPIMDKGLLGALRVSQIHKSLVLKKFEKYVSSYVIGGSLVRGETKPTSDVDVFVVIDDTDVKRMPRLELKEKLRGIIYSYIQEAEAIAGVKNKLSPQIYLMTDFWESVKDAHPVMFTFIRDGVPLYDRGAFLPWKQLLRMGRIKPSPEAIDMFMSSGDKLKETVERRIFDIAVLDLFWGISTPTQGLLMLYGQAPGNVYDTTKAFRETFVKKEKLIESKYADIFDEIALKYFKAYEHGKIKPGDIDGKKLDKLANDALDYIKRLKELRAQIERRVNQKSIEEIYEQLFGMLEALLNKKTESAIIKSFEEDLIKEGKFPPKFLDNLKFIAEIKKKFENKKSIKVVKKNKKGNDKNDKTEGASERREVDKARKDAAEIINELIEYTQRKDLVLVEKTRYVLQAKDFGAEVFFLENVFVVMKGKIQKVSGEKLVDSNPNELQEQLVKHKERLVKIDFKALDVLKDAYGNFDLVK